MAAKNDISGEPRKLFVSHAAADKPFVDAFVKDLLVPGCDLRQTEIFYTSQPAQGIAPGSWDFREYVRRHALDAPLVVAVVTPNFMASAFCLNEVGAAWALSKNFFPVAVPGFKRSDLSGVLPGVQVPAMDEEGVLGLLHERICAAMEREPRSSLWGPALATFNALAGDLVNALPTPHIIAAATHQATIDELAATKVALKEALSSSRKLSDQLARVAAASSTEEAVEAALPADEMDKFEALVAEADDALSEVSRVVRLAIWGSVSGNGFFQPSRYDDPSLFDEIADEAKSGQVEVDEGKVTPNAGYRSVRLAVNAAERLKRFLSSEISESFEAWFDTEYGVPLDLRQKAVWDALL